MKKRAYSLKTAHIFEKKKIFSTILAAILEILVCEIQDPQNALGFVKTFLTNLKHST